MKWLALWVALVTAPTMAAEAVEYPATFLHNYDGDTVTLIIHIWPGLSMTTSTRLKGIDTPEIRGQCEEEQLLAIVARDTIRELLNSHQTLTVAVYGLGKYGRPLVTLKAGTLDVGAKLIELGVARVYDGGRRESWCPPV